MSLVRLAVVLAALALSTATHSAPSRPFVLGVGTHFGLNRGDVDKLMDAMVRSDLRSFRDEIHWHLVERTRGEYALPPAGTKIMRAIGAARTHGIAPLLILCYGNSLYGEAYPVSAPAQDAFARYAEYMARALQGSVRHFEVWNEWNLGLNSPEGATAKAPHHYYRLLQRAHAAIKRGNPDAMVVAGAVEGGGHTSLAWIDRLLALGGRKYMDALSVHPYLHHAGPQANPERLWDWFARLDEILQRHGISAGLPIFVTEIGWPTYRGPIGLSEDQAADYAARTLLVLRTVPSVRGVWWYNLQNDGTDPSAIEHNFGLLAADHRRKPAYQALARVGRLVAGARHATRLSAPPQVWAVRLDGEDGGTTLAVWTTSKATVALDVELKLRGEAEATIDGIAGTTPTAQAIQRLSAGTRQVRLHASPTPSIVQLPPNAVESTGVRMADSK